MKNVAIILLLASSLADLQAQTLYPAKTKSRYGYIDSKGHWIIPERFSEAFPFYDGRARVKMNKGWTYIDQNGKPIREAGFEKAYDFEGGVARVAVRAKASKVLLYGLIDPDGIG